MGPKQVDTMLRCKMEAHVFEPMRALCVTPEQELQR
jgi:hypothetical protein